MTPVLGVYKADKYNTMLITEILNELTLPQTPRDAGVVLKNAGYQPVGEGGNFGKVWARPGESYVLKLFDPADHGYLSFVLLAQKTRNKHFPIFRGRPVLITKEYAAIRIEHLAPVPSGMNRLITQCANYLERINTLSYYNMSQQLTPKNIKNKKNFEIAANKFKTAYPDLADAIDLIQSIIGTNPNLINDIDDRNCGMRGNDLVFFDPIGWGGSIKQARSFGEGVESLTELFNTSSVVTEIDPERYTFTVNDNIFEIKFDAIYGRPKGEYDVTLARIDRKGSRWMSRGDMGNSAIAVYSTLTSVILQFLKTYKPRMIQFFGFDNRQQALYKRMVHLLITRSQNYELSFEKKG